jgi:hypothetical protein
MTGSPNRRPDPQGLVWNLQTRVPSAVAGLSCPDGNRVRGAPGRGAPAPPGGVGIVTRHALPQRLAPVARGVGSCASSCVEGAFGDAAKILGNRHRSRARRQQARRLPGSR